MNRIHKKFEPFLKSLNENVSSGLETETILHILNLKIDEKIEELGKILSVFISADRHTITDGSISSRERDQIKGEIKALNWVKDHLSSFEKTNESNETEIEDPDYKEYFMDKMEEFGVDSPSEMSKDQWEEINRGWTSEDEGNYHTFFRNKMEEFGVDSPEEITKDEWTEINRLWDTEEE